MYAYKQVQSVRLILQKMRENCVQEFNTIFAESLKLGQDLHGKDFELTKPRIARRQSHRSNIETCSAEQYYCVTMYNEFLSHVIRELDNRFSGNQYLVHGFLHLVPSKVASKSHDDFPETLSQAADHFKDDLTHHSMLSIEYRMWSGNGSVQLKFQQSLLMHSNHVMRSSFLTYSFCLS